MRLKFDRLSKLKCSLTRKNVKIEQLKTRFYDIYLLII